MLFWKQSSLAASAAAAVLLLLAAGVPMATADCVCECGTIAEEVCAQDACDFICAAAGDYGGDCGAGVIENCEDVECLSTELPVYSCSQQAFVAAGDVTVGEELRTRTGECSPVYFVHRHYENESSGMRSPAVEIQVEDETHESNTIVLSKNHLVYITSAIAGVEQAAHTAVPAKSVEPGDELMTTSTSSVQTVVHVKEITTPTRSLVNILTVQGSVEVAGGIVISSYSYNETLYATIFAPLCMLYQIAGSWAVPNLGSMGEKLERTWKPIMGYFLIGQGTSASSK